MKCREDALVIQLDPRHSAAAEFIVEGAKRQTNADYARFLNIAEASLAETE